MQETHSVTQHSTLSPQPFSWWRFILLAACFVLPLLGFGIAGAVWLYDQGWLGWASLTLISGEALALWLFRRWMRSDRSMLPQPSTRPPLEFSPREEAAWQVVQEYQDRVESNEITLASLEQLLELGKEILNRVALFYQPTEKDPLGAVP